MLTLNTLSVQAVPEWTVTPTLPTENFAQSFSTLLLPLAWTPLTTGTALAQDKPLEPTQPVLPQNQTETTVATTENASSFEIPFPSTISGTIGALILAGFIVKDIYNATLRSSVNKSLNWFLLAGVESSAEMAFFDVPLLVASDSYRSYLTRRHQAFVAKGLSNFSDVQQAVLLYDRLNSVRHQCHAHMAYYKNASLGNELSNLVLFESEITNILAEIKSLLVTRLKTTWYPAKMNESKSSSTRVRRFIFDFLAEELKLYCDVLSKEEIRAANPLNKS